MTYEQKSKSFAKTSFGATGNSYLLFSIEDDNFAVPVEIVNQIEFFSSSKKVPGSPDYVIGITKLRDKIVTLIHLPMRLKIHGNTPLPGENHIIFIEKGSKIIGMLCDRVSNIVNIPKNTIKEDVEIINTNIPIDFLRGIVTLDEKIVILLNTDLILSNFVVEEVSFRNEKFRRELGDNYNSKSNQINYEDFDSETGKLGDFGSESYETDDTLTDELYDTEEEDKEDEENF